MAWTNCIDKDVIVKSETINRENATGTDMRYNNLLSPASRGF